MMNYPAGHSGEKDPLLALIPAHLRGDVIDTLELIGQLSEIAELDPYERKTLGHHMLRFTALAVSAGRLSTAKDLWIRAGQARFPSQFSLAEQRGRLGTQHSPRLEHQGLVAAKLLLVSELSAGAGLRPEEAIALSGQISHFAILAAAADTGESTTALWISAGEQSGAYDPPREISPYEV
jgi:hypothetical protein